MLDILIKKKIRFVYTARMRMFTGLFYKDGSMYGVNFWVLLLRTLIIYCFKNTETVECYCLLSEKIIFDIILHN